MASGHINHVTVLLLALSGVGSKPCHVEGATGNGSGVKVSALFTVLFLSHKSRHQILCMQCARNGEGKKKGWGKEGGRFELLLSAQFG